MATIDPRRLKPSELCRVLNSTPLGEVIAERQLHRHRTRAGYRIGDGRSVDLFRYVAWLVTVRHAPKPEADDGQLTGYDALKEQARLRNKRLSLSGRNIGELPPVVEPGRKSMACQSFQGFCEAYFPHTFNLTWCDDHLKVIAKIELAVLHGGLFAMAMPRGSGKTTLCEIACLWAILIGARNYVCLIGSDEDHTASMLESIKSELENNDLVLEDFPEVVYPIHCLEGIHQRTSGQLYNGEQTHIGWTAKRIVLPTIPGSKASGAIIGVAGITGRIRGFKYKRPDGMSVRPSLVLIDDPQTDESARSQSQCAVREALLAGAILGLAGPGNKIAGLMTLTVVRPDDLADRILNREKHPQWQGERTKMVYAFPTNEAMWSKYAELRANGLRNERGIVDATEFYRQNQSAMDAGAFIAWSARFNHDELSAVQHAMNLRYQDEAAFWAEYQNEPLPETKADDDLLTVHQIASKTNGLKRGDVSIGCTRITMFIDVQAKVLFWLVAAWEDDFTGYVIDYGAWPDQKQPYFTLRDARRTLAMVAPRAGIEGAIRTGLDGLTSEYLGRMWRRDDGAEMRIDRCVIDANWGQSSDVVYEFCRQSPFASVVMPSHGRYVGASGVPFAEYKKKPGERVGLIWRVPITKGKRALRHILFDTNYWKSFVHARLAVPIGDPGCLSLFGHKPEEHRLLAEHLTAEYRVKTEGRGRTVDEWKVRVEGNDNHWLDCLVGAAVAASMHGAVLFGTDGARSSSRPRVKLSSLQRVRR